MQPGTFSSEGVIVIIDSLFEGISSKFPYTGSTMIERKSVKIRFNLTKIHQVKRFNLIASFFPEIPLFIS
ncbi:hypothetical protein D0X99_16405 [Algoriphagus lacus]|uniref:Uncharacterized protein n=1 Tax=Algoriphagus lacus TaxID=2056311 RepID=A0A418PNE9_9BACT|nr:hypothetical protein D0X99_16405 [Algoriphagus lacus]